jgi:nitric oxide dioxygenase
LNMGADVDLRRLIDYSSGGIISKVVVRSSALNITLFCMARGTDIEEHTSTKEGTVHVLEGEGSSSI